MMSDSTAASLLSCAFKFGDWGRTVWFLKDSSYAFSELDFNPLMMATWGVFCFGSVSGKRCLCLWLCSSQGSFPCHCGAMLSLAWTVWTRWACSLSARLLSPGPFCTCTKHSQLLKDLDRLSKVTGKEGVGGKPEVNLDLDMLHGSRPTTFPSLLCLRKSPSSFAESISFCLGLLEQQNHCCRSLSHVYPLLARGGYQSAPSPCWPKD